MSLEPVPKFIKGLMPDATETALQAAAQTFREFMKIVLVIHQRTNRENSVDSLESGFRDRVDDDPTV